MRASRLFTVQAVKVLWVFKLLVRFSQRKRTLAKAMQWLRGALVASSSDWVVECFMFCGFARVCPSWWVLCYGARACAAHQHVWTRRTCARVYAAAAAAAAHWEHARSATPMCCKLKLSVRLLSSYRFSVVSWSLLIGTDELFQLLYAYSSVLTSFLEKLPVWILQWL